MFIDAIEKAAAFTRPVHTIQRLYNGKQIIPGSSTLFFVNNDGWAVTCRHVMEMLIASDNINKVYNEFRVEHRRISGSISKSGLKGLEIKYKFKQDSTIQLKNTFVDCVDRMTGFKGHVHPVYDLALIKFEGFEKRLYNDTAIFLKDPNQVKQGKYLCRLGFPFPEFTNFTYNQSSDDIEWTKEGITQTPRFPIDGMVTRFLAENNQLYGIEMSTPGLKGQSGGPLFDENAIVYGMQFSTKHLHLGFDIMDREIRTNHGVRKVTDYSFLHLGQCIHSEIIKQFMREHNIEFREA